MPSTALQSRISAFEAIANPSLSSPSFSSSSNVRSPRPPSPSPPNLARKTSFIDLKDWVVDDGPDSLVSFESPPSKPTTPKPKSKPKLLSRAAAPPLPPRKSPDPGARPGTLAVHTYPPPRLELDTRSRNSSGHGPASSISSFHSVSLSSDTDLSTSGSTSSNFISTYPMDRDQPEHDELDATATSLDDSYEQVSTPSMMSPVTERLDWGRETKSSSSTPPILPQRPASSNSPTSTFKLPPPPPPPPKRQSTSTFSSSSSTPLPVARRPPPPPPPSRSSDRSSIQSAATSNSICSTPSHHSHSSDTLPLHPRTKRPTPVPIAARTRYESVFDANVVQCRKAVKLKETEKPALLSPTEARGLRRAAGWRGLSVDLVTAAAQDKKVPPDSPHIPPHAQDEQVNTVVENTDTLDGHIIKIIWRKTRLNRKTLSEIWTECDPDGRGCLTRDQFIKGMWRLDEELRRSQMQALKSANAPGLGSFQKNSIKPPLPKRKPILI